MKKIVYLKFTPLTKKVYTDCCMERLLSHGYSLDYWEISALLNVHYSNFESYNPNNQLVLRTINSYREFEQLVAQNTGVLYVTLMSLNFNQIKFLRILLKYKCKLAFWGPFPTPYEKHTTVDRIKKINYRAVRAKIRQEIVKMCFKFNIVHPIDFMFSAGKKGCLELCLGFHIQDFLKNILRFPINSSDYNNFKYKLQDGILGYDYIVFLDEYYPFHPDDELWGAKRYPSDIYFESLNKALDLIEKHFGLEVVVAAHPKALLYKDHNFFNGRKVFFNVTGSLVKTSKMVITHDSTSMSFAVMNKIPILQLSSDWLESNRKDLMHSIESFSRRLDLPILNMDRFKDTDLNNITLELRQTQEKMYDDFILDYCTSLDINCSNEELVVRYVNCIFETL